jgi:carbon monoxide dehydrogenase subunit G
MKLEFSGAPEIAASRERVWQRLTDPRFVARSAPGVESVEVIDATHFKVSSGFGAGSIKASLIMDGELFDLMPGASAKMRLRGRGAGSVVDVLTSIAIQETGFGRMRLAWSATSELDGTVTKLGARLIEGVARKLTEQFWADFARRVTGE